MESVDVSIQWPFKWCLVGSSGSGKTVFSLDLIKHVNRLINHAPSKLVIIYKEHQEIYNEFSNYFPTELIHEEEADIDFITKDKKLLSVPLSLPSLPQQTNRLKKLVR